MSNMVKSLTVGKLKSVIADLPDDLEVKLSSDTGVDQGEGVIIVEDAYRTKYETANFKVDYLTIYVNDIDEDDWEED